MSNKAKKNKLIKGLNERSAFAKNKTINTLLFFLAFFIIGGTNYYLMFHVFVPTFFVLDLFIIIFLVSPIFFFKKTMFDRIYLPIVLVLITLFYALNTSFSFYFGTVFSLKEISGALQNIAQVGMHSSSVQGGVLILNIALCLIFSLAIILFNALGRFRESQIELKKMKIKNIGFAISLLFASSFLFELNLQIGCTTQRARQIDDIDYVNYSPNYHFKQLGMISYYIQETRQFVLDKGETVEEIRSYLKGGSYLEDQYTHFFKDDIARPNILVVMVETGDSCIIDEKTTPHLCELLNTGIYCTHNYSGNHTNVSDTVAINGNYPQYQFLETKNMQMPFNLPNILGNDGYQTYFTADLDKINDIYDTMTQMKAYGFDEYLFHNDVIPGVDPWRYEGANYTRDSIFIDGLLNQILSFPQNTPFYMQYLTIHMHMDQIITPQNKSMFDDLEQEFGTILDNPSTGGTNKFDPSSEAGKKFRRFTLKSMDLDKGIKNIMDQLYRNPQREDLKNTLLVVYGDHPGYEDCPNGGTFAQQLRQRFGLDDIKQYSTILGFYHPQLNEYFANHHGGSHYFEYPTWPSVIVPTILDLLGETYNPRMYINKSIFDETYDDNEIFYSFWNAYFMNEHYSSGDHHTIKNIFDDNKTQKLYLQKLKESRLQLRIIDSIYRQDIFAHYDYSGFMPDKQGVYL